MAKQLLLYWGLFLPLFFSFQVKAQQSTFGFALNGQNEVPAIASAGTGTGTAVFDAATNILRVTGTFTGLTGNASLMHVHLGAGGVNGIILFTLNLSPSGGTSGSFSGSGVLTAAQITALNTSGLYLNLHSTTYPAGELRGQLVSNFKPITNFTFNMGGSNEVPAVASPGSGDGTATFDAFTNNFTIAGDFAGLTGNSTIAHVHLGAAGTNGIIVFSITINPVGGKAGTLTNSLVLDGAQVAALNTNGLYVNLHTDVFPAGELRGQIELAPDLAIPTTAIEPIPTLSEWGLIFMFFLLSTISILLIRRKQLVVGNKEDQVLASFEYLPFEPSIFIKSLLICVGVVITFFSIAIFVMNYEMTNADLPGSLMVIPLAAYFFHLFYLE